MLSRNGLMKQIRHDLLRHELFADDLRLLSEILDFVETRMLLHRTLLALSHPLSYAACGA